MSNFIDELTSESRTDRQREERAKNAVMVREAGCHCGVLRNATWIDAQTVATHDPARPIALAARIEAGE